jgi:hypothetical protein
MLSHDATDSKHRGADILEIKDYVGLSEVVVGASKHKGRPRGSRKISQVRSA